MLGHGSCVAPARAGAPLLSSLADDGANPDGLDEPKPNGDAAGAGDDPGEPSGPCRDGVDEDRPSVSDDDTLGRDELESEVKPRPIGVGRG